MDQETQERLLRAEEVLLASWHAGADRGMDAFYSTIDAFGRGVLPISAEERVAFLDRTAPYVATARHVLFDEVVHVIHVLRRMEWVTEWRAVCFLRSRLTWVEDLYLGRDRCDEDLIDFEDLDYRIFRVGEQEASPLQPEDIPLGTPRSHWWWWLPEMSEEERRALGVAD